MTPDPGASALERDLPPHELRVRAERDPHRPGFHFVAPAGWMNAVSYTHLDVYKRQFQCR